jgi:hypothetical protein
VHVADPRHERIQLGHPGERVDLVRPRAHIGQHGIGTRRIGVERRGSEIAERVQGVTGPFRVFTQQLARAGALFAIARDLLANVRKASRSLRRLGFEVEAKRANGHGRVDRHLTNLVDARRGHGLHDRNATAQQDEIACEDQRLVLRETRTLHGRVNEPVHDAAHELLHAVAFLIRPIASMRARTSEPTRAAENSERT